MRARWILALFAFTSLTYSQGLVKLLPDNGAPGDLFGTAAIDGQVAVVGAYQANTAGSFSGTAYVFRRIGGDWRQEAQLRPVAAHSRFGWSTAIDLPRVVVGSVGRAHVFTRLSGSWSEEAVLVPRSAGFDARVAIDGDTIALADYSGNAAYVFRLVDGAWIEEARLTAGVSVPASSFGIGVAIDGERIVVGSRYEGTAGTAHVFERVGGTWAEVARLIPSNGSSGDNFGWYVAIEGDTIAIGAPYGEVSATSSGCVYVFQKYGSSWVEDAILVGSHTTALDRFSMVSLGDGRLVVGARNSDAAGLESGEAYVFVRQGTSWVERQRLVPPDGAAGDTFGVVFDTDGSSIIVGSPYDDDSGDASGSAYILDLQPPLDFPAVLRGGWLAALGHRLRAAAGLPR